MRVSQWMNVSICLITNLSFLFCIENFGAGLPMENFLRNQRNILIICSLCVLSLVSIDVKGKDAAKADKVILIQGDEQCVPPNSECPEEVRVEFLSPVMKGFLGGKGTRHPVPGVVPMVELEKGADLKVELIDKVSDAGGRVRLKVKTGRKLGDNFFWVYAKDNPKAKTKVRIINGVVIEGNAQEGYCGQTLDSPLTVTVYQADGQPAPGVPVHFSLVSSPEGKKVKTKIKPQDAVTDANGKASAFITIGHKTGIYKGQIEIISENLPMHVRAIPVVFYGKDFWSLSGVILTVLCGLGIFIYGMRLMTEGLILVAGDNMRKLLRVFTSNRLIALIAGTVVTGVIQSSSACTVMVVGFVNAGLMSLRQAIGVIFGANIGTTVTAQIISFKISHLAPLAIVVGLLVFFLFKSTIVKGWGRTVLGFGFLFFGLGIMSHQLKGIADFPSIIAFFQTFDCSPAPGTSYMPIGATLGAICIGTMMTVIIQSSSATIGIALALAANGLLNFYTAVPLILGDNIGTTITAVLASLGANKRARQAALAHVFFNIVGTTYMVLLFYCPWQPSGKPPFMAFIDFITPGDVFSPEMENITRHIAMAHTCFNVFNAFLFLPFLPLMVKLCNFIIKIEEEEEIKFNYLDEHLLETPSFALEQVISSIRYMTKSSWKMIRRAMEDQFLKEKFDEKLVDELNRQEERIDRLQSEVTDFLVKLTRRELTEVQTALVPLLMHCVNDAEKIADITDNLNRLCRRYQESKQKFSPEAREEIQKVWKEVKQLADHVIEALDSSDSAHIKIAHVEENKIDRLRGELEEKHVKRLAKGECHAVSGIIFIELLAELEKLGDHFTNIADRTPKIQEYHLVLRDQKKTE
ncbi:MAG: hypothetical protein D6820_05010 [Lentisphaerae bacterium]|nr:MAG: hypothetical protein D6820_05010 [Lentisphaerota bacterium]